MAIQKKVMQERLAVEQLKQEFEQTLSIRVERRQKLNRHLIVPYTEFAPVSDECQLLFRDGYYYACIALSQSVAEALARFLCEKNGWSPNKKFENNISKLNARGFISGAMKDKFLEIWEKRDDYHHLNSNTEADRKDLEALAYKRVLLLSEIESEIFKFSIVDGKLRPENPKYWKKLSKDALEVMLRMG